MPANEDNSSPSRSSLPLVSRNHGRTCWRFEWGRGAAFSLDEADPDFGRLIFHLQEEYLVATGYQNCTVRSQLVCLSYI